MKKCTMCLQVKPESDFWRRSRNSSQLCSRCKNCQREITRLYHKDNNVEIRRTARERYRQKRRDGWKPLIHPDKRKIGGQLADQFYKDRPARQHAKAHVREAAKRGKRIIAEPSCSHRIRADVLLKYPYCPTCGKRTPTNAMHGHHHHGYAKPLDVLFVCQQCHGAITALERDAIREGLPALAGLAIYINEQQKGRQ